MAYAAGSKDHAGNLCSRVAVISRTREDDVIHHQSTPSSCQPLLLNSSGSDKLSADLYAPHCLVCLGLVFRAVLPPDMCA